MATKLEGGGGGGKNTVFWRLPLVVITIPEKLPLKNKKNQHIVYIIIHIVRDFTYRMKIKINILPAKSFHFPVNSGHRKHRLSPEKKYYYWRKKCFYWGKKCSYWRKKCSYWEKISLTWERNPLTGERNPLI